MLTSGSMNKDDKISSSNLPQEEFKDGDDFDIKFDKQPSLVSV